MRIIVRKFDCMCCKEIIIDSIKLSSYDGIDNNYLVSRKEQ